MIKKIIKIILVVLWMGVIFSFSSDSGDKSEAKSDGVILSIYKMFNKDIISKNDEKKIIEKYVFSIRKLAHFTEYLILGLLVISLIKEFKSLDLKYLIIAILICMLYAVSDEIHQMFSAGRTAKMLDILIDTIGSTTGVFLYYIVNIKLLKAKE